MIGNANEPRRPDDMPPVDGKRWWEEPRWKGKPPPPPGTWSQQRIRAHADRRYGLVVGDDARNKSAHGVELARCVTGSDIVAGWRGGDFFRFPLVERRGKVCVPPGAKWKLRGKRLELLGVIAGAMIGLPVAGGPAHGVCATLDELGEVLGLRRTQVGEYLHELQAWGLVHRLAIYAPFGRVHSQRANCFRLTTLAALAFRLVVRVQLPGPDLEVQPRRRRVRAPATAPGTGPAYAPGASGARVCEVAVGNPDANPETPVPGDSSGERVALLEKSSTRSACGVGAALPSPPDVSTDDTTASVETRPDALGSRGLVLATRRVGDAVRDVKRGDVDDGRRRAGERLQREREDAARRRELERQLDQQRRKREVAERMNRPLSPPPAPRPPVLTDAELEAMRVRDRELAAERARKKSVEKPDDVLDILAVVEKAWRSAGVDTEVGDLGHTLFKLRRDRGGES